MLTWGYVDGRVVDAPFGTPGYGGDGCGRAVVAQTTST